MNNKYSCILICVWMIFSCKSENIQEENVEVLPVATSLLGQSLFPLSESKATTQKKDSLLTIAQTNFQKDPKNLEHIIWLGRRVAYLYDYQRAIGIFTEGLGVHPESPELYRHRGHRYISVRKFDLAISDFQKAVRLMKGRGIEIEPDGMPNKKNIPLSNLQFNVYYHWGLAHYLKGEFERAADLYRDCMTYSNNPDLMVATVDWYYMTLMRLGKKEEAKALLDAIPEHTSVIENDAYLKRIQVYKGNKAAADLLDLSNKSEEAQLNIVTQGYGIGNYYLSQGDSTHANSIFKEIVACDYWPAFGYIAAEAELFREKSNSGS